MKQASLLLALSLSLTSINSARAAHDLIILEQINSFIDGLFVNADSIEMLHTFLNKMNRYVYGVKDSHHKMVGHYVINGSHYSIPEIVHQEYTLKNSSEYKVVLTQAKKDLITLAQHFFSHAMQAKPMIIRLIEEDVKQRDRHNSILEQLAKAPNGQEDAIFNKLVNNFADLHEFCIDLTNFIHDVIHSCPKAQQQLKNRYAKLSSVKKQLENVAHNLRITIDTKTEKLFLAHVKQKHIDTLTMHEITTDRVTQLFAAFRS